MKLNFVEIENFRSIKKEAIHFNPSGRTLVGINESGKSNLLRALSMLSADIKPTKEDIRESLPKESEISEAFVDFIFELENEEVEQAVQNILKSEVVTANIDEPIVKEGQEEFTLREFCELRGKPIYRVIPITGNKTIIFYKMER